MKEKLGTKCSLIGMFALAMVSDFAFAQRLRVERSKVLATAGGVEITTIALNPLATSPGLVFKLPIHRPGALALRVRFTVTAPSQDWAIVLRGASGAVAWTTWHGAPEASGEFWSDEIPGDSVNIEVLSARPNNMLEASIDRVVASTIPSTPVSITVPDERESIENSDNWVRILGKSVARLRFVGDNGKAYFCTAFLVSRDLLLTNEHCIATDSERRSALVDFDYDGKTSEPTALRLSHLVAKDVGLDYSLVRLERSLDRSPLPLEEVRVASGLATIIIQHPAGEPKQISVKDCRVLRATMTGVAGSPTDFGHACDTLGGSSGSPVLNLANRTVAGLHHLGIPEDSDALVNQATHIQLILANLPPDVRSEIASP